MSVLTGVSTASTSSTATSLDGLRVLLIEDTWIIAQSYAALLEPLGVEVVGPAASVAEARRLLDGAPADVALVDMNLQGEMADGLINALCDRGVPVVVVTGYEVMPELSGKVRAVLKKPIRAEHLLRTLRSIAGPE